MNVRFGEAFQVNYRNVGPTAPNEGELRKSAKSFLKSEIDRMNLFQRRRPRVESLLLSNDGVDYVIFNGRNKKTLLERQRLIEQTYGSAINRITREGEALSEQDIKQIGEQAKQDLERQTRDLLIPDGEITVEYVDRNSDERAVMDLEAHGFPRTENVALLQNWKACKETLQQAWPPEKSGE